MRAGRGRRFDEEFDIRMVVLRFEMVENAKNRYEVLVDVERYQDVDVNLSIISKQ